MSKTLERTNKRSSVFSGWIRKKLPDPKAGFCVTDIDWLFWNWRTRKLMLVEEKTKMGSISPWFRKFLQNVLNPALKEYCAKNEIDYRGFHLLQFVNDGPEDGMILLNGKEVTEEELIKFLSMKDAQETEKKDDR